MDATNSMSHREDWVIHKISNSPCLTITQINGTKIFLFTLSSAYTFFQIFCGVPTVVCVNTHAVNLIAYQNGYWAYRSTNHSYFYHDATDLYFYVCGYGVHKCKDQTLEKVSTIVLKPLMDGSEYIYSDNSIKIRKGNVEIVVLDSWIYRVTLVGNLLHVITDFNMRGSVIDMDTNKRHPNYMTTHITRQDDGCYYQSHRLSLCLSRNYISYTTPTTNGQWTKLFVHDCQNDDLQCFGHFVLDNIKYVSTKNKLIIISILWLFKRLGHKIPKPVILYHIIPPCL